MKTILTVEVNYQPQYTDSEGLAGALDRLMETALSIPGILEEYGNPAIGEFFVVDSKSKSRMFPPRMVLNIHGGVLQDVYCDHPRAKIILVDWDTEAIDATEEDVVEIADSRGDGRLAAVTAYPVAPLADLAGTDTLAALQAAGIEGIP
jgi:hypothetical protein